MATKSGLSTGALAMLRWAVDGAYPQDHSLYPGQMASPLYLYPVSYEMLRAKTGWEKELLDGGYVVHGDEMPARVTTKGFEAGR